MCGNFSLHIDKDFYPRFHTKSKLTFTNTNIRPTSNAPIILNKDNNIVAEIAEWSLMPKELREGKKYSTFNARIERLLDSRLYKEPFIETRCIVPMNKYFEWHKKEDDQNQKDKYEIRVANEEYLGVAGLFKIWHIMEKEILCFTIITAPADNFLKSIHDRMPIVLNQEDENLWIDPTTTQVNLMQILEKSREHNYQKAIISK